MARDAAIRTVPTNTIVASGIPWSKVDAGICSARKLAAMPRIAAAHRAQADALEIEAGAKRRLADEYDAAQDVAK